MLDENGLLYKELIKVPSTSLTWPDLFLAKIIIDTSAKVGGIYTASDNKTEGLATQD